MIDANMTFRTICVDNTSWSNRLAYIVNGAFKTIRTTCTETGGIVFPTDTIETSVMAKAIPIILTLFEDVALTLAIDTFHSPWTMQAGQTLVHSTVTMHTHLILITFMLI